MLLTVLKLNTVPLPISNMFIYNFILKLVVQCDSKSDCKVIFQTNFLIPHNSTLRWHETFIYEISEGRRRKCSVIIMFLLYPNISEYNV